MITSASSNAIEPLELASGDPRSTPSDTRPELLLAIDSGTQSVRALLFDLTGNLVARVQVPFTEYKTPQPGWLEHDGELYWQAAASACQQLWVKNPAWREAVKGVAVTTQRATIMPVDAQGQCIYPAINWLDQRNATKVPAISLGWRALLALVGATDTVQRLGRVAEINWIAENKPEIHARTYKYLFVSGLFNHRLTGRYVESVGSLVGFVPFDYKKQEWAAPGSFLWQAVDAKPEQLPELVPVGTQLGRVTADAAAATGIPVGTPVIAAAADKACEILGSGALTPEIGAISYGTTATINVTSERYFEANQFEPAYPAAVPGKFSSEIQIYRGYWMVSWFKEQFGLAERLAAKDMGLLPEELFDELIAPIPPGCMGLMLQPYWSPGTRQPGPDAKGAIIGFGDVHTRAHLYRAILEGLAYALREGSTRIVAKSNVPLKELRVSGGGSQSDAAMQLTADIFNLPVIRTHTHETSGLGAAINIAVGLGLYADYPSALSAMSHVGRRFEPIPENAALYDALYKEVYTKMYKRLSPLNAAIQRITGYPKLC
jgi:sugar (pentulose or hexulose) kinase